MNYMNKAAIILCFLINLSGTAKIYAQDESDFSGLRAMPLSVLNQDGAFVQSGRQKKMKIFPDYHEQVFHPALKHKNSGTVPVFFSFLFWGYKNIFSIQDASSCSFSPSCSEFGLDAIRKKGLLIGSLLTFDRLTRCNGMSREKYSLTQKKLLYDPVE